MPKQYPSGLLVANEQCEHCLFGKSPIVGKSRVKQIIRDCRKTDTHFLCHVPKSEGDKTEIVCRGFYDTQTSQMIRIAGRIGMLFFVDVEKKSNG